MLCHDEVLSHTEPHRSVITGLVITDSFGVTHTLCPLCLKKADGQLWLVRTSEGRIYADAALVGFMRASEQVEGATLSPNSETVIIVAGSPSSNVGEPKLVTWHLRATQLCSDLSFGHASACKLGSLMLQKAKYGPEHLMMAKRKHA